MTFPGHWRLLDSVDAREFFAANSQRKRWLPFDLCRGKEDLGGGGVAQMDRAAQC